MGAETGVGGRQRCACSLDATRREGPPRGAAPRGAICPMRVQSLDERYRGLTLEVKTNSPDPPTKRTEDRLQQNKFLHVSSPQSRVSPLLPSLSPRGSVGHEQPASLSPSTRQLHACGSVQRWIVCPRLHVLQANTRARTQRSRREHTIALSVAGRVQMRSSRPRRAQRQHFVGPLGWWQGAQPATSRPEMQPRSHASPTGTRSIRCCVESLRSTCEARRMLRAAGPCEARRMLRAAGRQGASPT